MTRFARSKGSSASNERVPEAATPWQVMKHQLEQKKQEAEEHKQRKVFEESRMENYKSFLEQKKNDIKSEWVDFEEGENKQAEEHKQRKVFGETRMENYKSFLEQKKNDIKSEWVDFEEGENKQDELRISKKEKKKRISKDSTGLENEFKLENLIDKIEKVLDKVEKATCNETQIKKTKSPVVSEDAVISTDNKPTKYKKGRKISIAKETVSSINDITDSGKEIATGEISKPSKNKNKIKLPREVHLNTPSTIKNCEANMNDDVNLDEVKQNKKKKYVSAVDTIADANINSDAIQDIAEQQQPKKVCKNKKGKIKNDKDSITTESKKPLEEMTEDDIKKVNKKKEKKLRQLESRKKKKAELKEKALKEQENQNIRKHKLPKERDNEEHKRRKPNTQVNKININGVDIDIDYYDGFPVKKDDAERLRKLKREMISKGIPKSEVFISLKLERRKAEKALTRERKKVCFNCRKSGHVLSECPDLNENSQQETSGTGICFKCGSTEHTHFECKVVRTDNFKYATCFICREQGHISRQCPDNQRGLYPNGGACRECGDVTHLKKDCPKFQEKQESQTVTLDTLEFNNVEDLPDTNKSVRKVENKSKRIVKF